MLLRYLFACSLAVWLAVASSGDWLNTGGDAQNTRWQKRETVLNSRNVAQIGLLWRRVLGGRLSSPVIQGHMATHRGTVELLFTLSSTGDLYAIDGDFGTVFWKRALGGEAFPCADAPMPAPALTPLPPPDPNEEEDDDAPHPLRPLFAVAPDLKLHAIHPGTGQDLSAPLLTLTKTPRVTDLVLQGTQIVMQAGPCHGAALTSRTIAVGGQEAPQNPSQTGTVFPLEGRLMLVGNGARLQPATKPVIDAPAAATREDAEHRRWVYLTEGDHITAYQVAKGRAFATPSMLNPAPPVLAADLLFVLDRGNAQHPAVLYAFHSGTGQLLYSSKDTIKAAAPQTDLAIANGHVCFTAADGTAYCFGLPMEKE